jgi:hypothetical protein
MRQETFTLRQKDQKELQRVAVISQCVTWSLACAKGKKLWFGGEALKQLIRQMKRKPELRAPASGPLGCYWGWGYVTAWRGTGGQPA